MPAKPRITVIIPTRERGEVLRAALRSVTAQDYDGLDILVSDNCSTDGTADIVRSAGDSRIRYVNTGKRLSMSHNWEFALSHVPNDDRFVMVIGDDDGLVPGALDRIAGIAADTGVKAINSNFVTFIWPREDNAHRGRLLVPMRQSYEVRDSGAWLRKAVEGVAWYSELPMLYVGGAVHMSLLDGIRARRGSFFQSWMPDIFSAVALSSVTDRYVFSHEPFGIAGHSRHSNGASWGASGNATSADDALKPNKIFESETNIPWHAAIPEPTDGRLPVSIDLLVYECYLQAEYLHGNQLGIGHKDVLAQFLARDIADKERMLAWSALFAERHGLDLADANRRAAGTRRRLKLARAREFTLAFRDIYRLEPGFGVQIRDVYEAGVVAEAILRTRPSRLKSYAATLTKRLRRSQPQPARDPSPA